jgi:hypothetical protein
MAPTLHTLRSCTTPTGRRLLALSALAASAGLALAGCAAAEPASSASSASPTRSASTTPSASASPTDRVDPDAPQGQCADDAMSVAVTPDQAGGAAGSIAYDVVITNTGTAQCVLDGYPGVSVVGGGDGSQIGPAADRTGDTPKPVTLDPGGTVTAVMTVANIGDAGGPVSGCTPVAGDGWRVYPPHSYRAYFVPDATVTACKDGPVWMHLTSGMAQTA